MGKLTEQIEEWPRLRPVGYIKFLKRLTGKQRRKESKDYCRNFDENKPEPEIKNHYEGWTI